MSGIQDDNGPLGLTMSPLKKPLEQAANNGVAPKRRSSVRCSILSDPRLSQLFELSSQLEALADSIEVMPSPRSSPRPPSRSTSTRVTSKLLLNGSKTPNGNQTLFPPMPVSATEEIKYEQLEDNANATANGDSATPDLNAAPAARYSLLSDMSTSSHAESTTLESLPSAHSILSESIMAGSITESMLGASADPWASQTLESPKSPKESVGAAAQPEKPIPAPPSCPPPPLPPGVTAVEPKTTEGWRERCHELEDSLSKFRDQAQSIRELLREKVGRLTAVQAHSELFYC